MARRKNALDQTDLLPNHAPIYAVDDWDSAVDLFLRDGKIRNISKHTIGFYRQELGKFKRILDEQKMSTDPNKVTEEVIKTNVILYLLDEEQKATSINCVLRAIRTLFNFLVKESYLLRSPMARVKLLNQKNTIIKTFSIEQIHRLFAQPDQKTFVGVRDLTVMMLFLETGIRLRELEDLVLSDIRWKDGTILVNGKNNK
ncbi:tyrosine-type recombinase/integrase [Paenibacillus sp. Leaf72]|uniref:tyrosine-type recombinase/integrase n=1 Tax=Paenibacillus sp. Leaf72 TaxID=1736234 RepID=UPI000AC14739